MINVLNQKQKVIIQLTAILTVKYISNSNINIIS